MDDLQAFKGLYHQILLPVKKLRRRQHSLHLTQPQSPDSSEQATVASTRDQNSISAAQACHTPRSILKKQTQEPLIRKSMTHVLVSTKELLEVFTRWSLGQAKDEELSNVYVRLGYEFNLTCRLLRLNGIETKDLGNVPDVLRQVLEEMLSNDRRRLKCSTSTSLKYRLLSSNCYVVSKTSKSSYGNWG